MCTNSENRSNKHHGVRFPFFFFFFRKHYVKITSKYKGLRVDSITLLWQNN